MNDWGNIGEKNNWKWGILKRGLTEEWLVRKENWREEFLKEK